MSFDTYKWFPSGGTFHHNSTMFAQEKPFTREPASSNGFISMKGRQSPSTVKVSQSDKLTSTAKECFVCIKQGHLTRAKVHEHLPHRTLEAVSSGVRVLIKKGYIRSVRKGKNGNAYEILKGEIE